MYLKDEIFFRTIWTNLRAQLASSRIDDRSIAAFRRERRTNLTTESPPGEKAKNETSFATVAFLALFFVVALLASTFALRWWWCEKKRRHSLGRRRFSSVGSERQKCRRKYEKVELVDKEEVHDADTLPVKRSRLCSRKSRTTASSKELKEENSGASEGLTKVEDRAARSSAKRNDFTVTASVEKPIEKGKSECQSVGKAESVRTEVSERQTDANTVRDFLEASEPESEETKLADRHNGDISATENTTDERRTNTSTLEAECKDSESEETDANTAKRSDGEYDRPKSLAKVSDESSCQLVFNGANDEPTDEDRRSVTNGTVASNPEYCACSIEEDDASANNSLCSTPAMITVLPVDITDTNLDTVQRKRRFAEIVAALPIGYCVRKQLEKGFAHLQKTVSPSNYSRTEKIGNGRSSEEPAECVGQNGADNESRCTSPVCADDNSMPRRLYGQTRSRRSSCVSKNEVESNSLRKTEDSTLRSSSSSNKGESGRFEEYCRCGSGNSDANSCQFAYSYSRQVSFKSDECGENETENVEVSSRISINSDSDSEIKCFVISSSFENVYFP